MMEVKEGKMEEDACLPLHASCPRFRVESVHELASAPRAEDADADPTDTQGLGLRTWMRGP